MVQCSNDSLKTLMKKACFWSKMSSVWMIRQVTWLNYLNTGHPYCPGIQMNPVFRCWVFRWSLYLTLKIQIHLNTWQWLFWFSDECSKRALKMSKYWTFKNLSGFNHLNTGLVQYHYGTVAIRIQEKSRYLNGPYMSRCQMVQFFNGGLKTRQKCMF